MTESELAPLRQLALHYPTIDYAVAEIARLSAILTLPKGTVHVISDIHGEEKKLRHVINNASGTLRPMAEKLLRAKMSPKQFDEFLTLLFYPAEVVARLEQSMTDPAAIKQFAIPTLRHQLELVRALAARYSLKRGTEVFPPEYKELLLELLHEPTTDRNRAFLEAIVEELTARGRALHLVHIVGRLIRNLAIYELIIAGDCWDRGPRGDRVVDYLRQQPKVSFVWGNHDMAWLGAALGQQALLCHVLRVSLRYRNIGQLDEGYSIPMTPLEHLANTVYRDDPAAHFMPKKPGLRPMLLVARMQKAAAIMQFKLEGQMIARNPQWKLDHRRLLHHIDLARGTISVDGVTYPLRDSTFPTLDPDNPYQLSPEESLCINRMTESVRISQKLQEHMRYLVGNGAMYLVRDNHLIFHGCVPCDAAGNFLPMPIDGREYAGKAMFDAIEKVVLRALDRCETADLDLLWYLWSGPRSPLFGKDRIATLERDFIADKKPHHEQKDPYFDLIHEPAFCDKVLAEFGVESKDGLIVNGHVPVKIEAGEPPLKRSGKAITIDGAFSEAYGDHGYTLVLEADRTLLAKHHHFESVEAAIATGVDIVPSTSLIRTWPVPRKMSNTERGRQFVQDITLLQALVEAYRCNLIKQRCPRP